MSRQGLQPVSPQAGEGTIRPGIWVTESQICVRCQGAKKSHDTSMSWDGDRYQSTRSKWEAGSACLPALGVLGRIVGRFLGDGNVVGMAFYETGGGDADEFAVFAELVDGSAAAVAHAAS